MTSHHGNHEPRPLEVEDSTAGASGGRDLEEEAAFSRALRLADYLEALIPHVAPCICDACLTLRESVMFMRELVPDSYRRTNEPGGLEVEGSTAGASGGRDLEKLKAIRRLFHEELAVYPGDDALRIIHKVLDIMNVED